MGAGLKAFKITVIILVGFLILLVGGAALGGYYVYAQATTQTRPEVQQESLESYATNIANSLLQNRELEIPAEILSYLVSQQSGRDVTCVVSQDNRLQIWVTEKLDYIGEADICFILKQQDYQKEAGVLSLTIEEIDVGRFQVPSFLQDRVLQLAEGLSGDKIRVSGDRVSLVVDSFSADVLGSTLSIGVDTVNLRDGKLYFSLYALMN